MQPLAKGKTLSYTFMLPLLYGQNKEELTKHIKNIDNVYIGENNTIHCVNTSNKAIYSPKIDTKYTDQYNLFIEGKYSKFSGYFKLLIIKFWYVNKELIGLLFRHDNHTSDKFPNHHRWSDNVEFISKPIKRFEQYKP